MNDRADAVTIALRVPGLWSHPKELVDALPADHRLTPESLFLPDGSEIGFGAAGADNQFAHIFRSSCRQPATDDELATVDNHKVNVFVTGPGGSMDVARTMMQAGSAIIRAGGAGVFSDNCGLAHGGQNWIALAEDGGPDALSFAFTAIVEGRTEISTMGLHVLGLRDVIMSRTDVERGGFDIVEMIRYLAQGDKPVGDGHIIAGPDGPRFRVTTLPGDPELARSPMHNPFGRLKLVSLRDVAEAN
jgi:hypothetical protein